MGKLTVILAILVLFFGETIAQKRYRQLFLHLALENNQGKRVVDKSGINYCTCNGTGLVHERDGYRLTSAGSDYIECGNKKIIPILNNFTVSFWFKRSSATAVHVGKYTGVQKSFLLQIFTDNKVYFVVSDNGSNDLYFSSTGTITNTNWNLLTAVYNGGGAGNSTRAMVYLNGVLMAGTYTGTIPATMFSSTTNIEIGRYNAATYSNSKIDDVRIYGSSFTANEVMDLYINTKKQ